LVYVTPRSHNKVATGSSNVVMQVNPLHCESLPAIPQPDVNQVKLSVTSSISARLARELMNLALQH
jgi:hypothetical protein